jgi:hypothetical protein
MAGREGGKEGENKDKRREVDTEKGESGVTFSVSARILCPGAVSYLLHPPPQNGGN